MKDLLFVLAEKKCISVYKATTSTLLTSTYHTVVLHIIPNTAQYHCLPWHFSNECKCFLCLTTTTTLYPLKAYLARMLHAYQTLQFSCSRHVCESSAYCTCKNFWFSPPINSALTCSKHWTWYIHIYMQNMYMTFICINFLNSKLHELSLGLKLYITVLRNFLQKYYCQISYIFLHW